MDDNKYFKISDCWIVPKKKIPESHALICDLHIGK